MDGWSPRMFGLFDGDRSRLGVAPDGALLPVGVVGTTSATLVKVSPPSVDSATKTSGEVLTRYAIQRLPNRSHASCSSQQIGPSGAPAPMTCRVQFLPPSDDTPSNSPLGTSGSVDRVTMFDGLVGLMAIASSASLPGMTLASKFGGGWPAAAADPAGAIIAASSATAAQAGAEASRTRDFRHCILASRRWAPAPGRSHATAIWRPAARGNSPAIAGSLAAPQPAGRLPATVHQAEFAARPGCRPQ